MQLRAATKQTNPNFVRVIRQKFESNARLGSGCHKPFYRHMFVLSYILTSCLNHVLCTVSLRKSKRAARIQHLRNENAIGSSVVQSYMQKKVAFSADPSPLPLVEKARNVVDSMTEKSIIYRAWSLFSSSLILSI